MIKRVKNLPFQALQLSKKGLVNDPELLLGGMQDYGLSECDREALPVERTFFYLCHLDLLLDLCRNILVFRGPLN